MWNNEYEISWNEWKKSIRIYESVMLQTTFFCFIFSFEFSFSFLNISFAYQYSWMMKWQELWTTKEPSFPVWCIVVIPYEYEERIRIMDTTQSKHYSEKKIPANPHSTSSFLYVLQSLPFFHKENIQFQDTHIKSNATQVDKHIFDKDLHPFHLFYHFPWVLDFDMHYIPIVTSTIMNFPFYASVCPLITLFHFLFLFFSTFVLSFSFFLDQRDNKK